MVVTREKLEEVKMKLEGVGKILKLGAGKTSVRFVAFPKNEELEAGMFEAWQGHWTPYGFTACLRTFRQACPICNVIKKYLPLIKDHEKRNRLYRVRSKNVFISYVSPNEKPDNSGEWLPPKLYIVSKTAATTIVDKFLNIIDGDFYPPDANPSYALIITKKINDPNLPPTISYDLSRKVYEIPNFEVNPLKEELVVLNEITRIAENLEMYWEEQLHLDTPPAEEEIDEEVEEILKEWE